MVFQTPATPGPMHGYAINARIEPISSGAIQPDMGKLYRGLPRLEQRGFIRTQWDRTETNRRQLQTEKTEWARRTAMMQAVLEGDAG
jgi:DNA-binding PadR family transcriptional regulator